MEHAHFDTDENRWLSGEPRTPVTSDLGGSQGKDELVAIRKRVYGHDMLYVSQPDGSKIGRINLETGRITMDRAELRDIFDRFVAGWRATHMGQQPPSDDDRDEGTRPTGPHASHESNPTPHAGLPTPQTPDPPGSRRTRRHVHRTRRGLHPSRCRRLRSQRRHTATICLKLSRLPPLPPCLLTLPTPPAHRPRTSITDGRNASWPRNIRRWPTTPSGANRSRPSGR